MTGNMAVNAVVKHINEAKIVATYEDEYSKRRKLVAYKYEKPAEIKGEYIVVNHLPFIHNNVVQEGLVNINIHVPALRINLPNVKRLSELANKIIELFPEGTYLEKAFYEFMTDSRPTLDDDNTYYINIQINVTYNNLN